MRKRKSTDNGLAGRGSSMNKGKVTGSVKQQSGGYETPGIARIEDEMGSGGGKEMQEMQQGRKGR